MLCWINSLAFAFMHQCVNYFDFFFFHFFALKQEGNNHYMTFRFFLLFVRHVSNKNSNAFAEKATTTRSQRLNSTTAINFKSPTFPECFLYGGIYLLWLWIKSFNSKFLYVFFLFLHVFTIKRICKKQKQSERTNIMKITLHIELNIKYCWRYTHILDKWAVDIWNWWSACFQISSMFSYFFLSEMLLMSLNVKPIIISFAQMTINKIFACSFNQ